MAQDNKQTKSFLYRLSLNNNGKQLNNSIADILALGQKCIDAWVEGDNNDIDGRKLLQPFQTVEVALRNMQECISNVVNPSSLTHKIFEDSVEFRRKPSDCKCHIKISKLHEQIAIEKDKYQLLLKDKEILTKEKQDVIKKNAGLEELFRIKEALLKKQKNMLIENLKQKLSDVEQELDGLRFQIRTQVTSLKHDLKQVDCKNYELRQRLLKIPALEQNFDQQRQTFIMEIRTCKFKINELEKNLNNQIEDLCKITEENRNLKRDVLKKTDFKLKEVEYRKTINTLEECITYFVKQNSKLRLEKSDLKLKLNISRSEKILFQGESANNGQEIEKIVALDDPHTKNNFEITNHQNHQGEDFLFEEHNANNRLEGGKEEVTRYDSDEDVDKNELYTAIPIIVNNKEIQQNVTKENIYADNAERKHSNHQREHILFEELYANKRLNLDKEEVPRYNSDKDVDNEEVCTAIPITMTNKQVHQNVMDDSFMTDDVARKHSRKVMGDKEVAD